MFYRPGSGFPQSFAVDVPLATATSTDAQALGVTLSDGRKVNLYRVTIPLDPGLLSSFADMDIVEIELTKQVQLYRTYPDPISYSYHQAGMPSSVHVYAATLQQVPVGFEWTPAIFGHVWQAPAQPQYIATLTNYGSSVQVGRLQVTTRSYDGTEESKQEMEVSLPATPTMQAPNPVRVTVNVPVKLYGYHDVQATLSLGDQKWTEKRSLVSLAPDTRSARWAEGRGTLFGYWSYGGGGHYTPNDRAPRPPDDDGRRPHRRARPIRRNFRPRSRHWSTSTGCRTCAASGRCPRSLGPRTNRSTRPRSRQFTKEILAYLAHPTGSAAGRSPARVRLFLSRAVDQRAVERGEYPRILG